MYFRNISGTLVWLLSGILAACASGAADSGAGDRGNQWFVERAYDYLSQRAQQMGLESPAKELYVKQVVKDNLQKVHIQLVQQVEGVPVWGHALYLHMDNAGQVYRVSGKVIPGLHALQLPPILDSTEAGWRMFSGEKSGKWRMQMQKLYIYVDDPGGPVPVYQVELTQGLWRRFLLVDARNGEVLKRIEGSPSRHFYNGSASTLSR